MNIIKIDSEGLELIELAQNKHHWWSFMIVVMKFRIPKIALF